MDGWTKKGERCQDNRNKGIYIRGERERERERERENLKGSSEEHRLQGVIHAEVETPVDNNAHTRDVKTTIEPRNAIRSVGLPVDIYEAIELSLSTLFCRFCIICQSGSGVV